MGVSVLLRVFISSNEVCNTAYAPKRIHEQNSVFKYTTMGQMIPKEMKHNLHCGDVWGDVLKKSIYIKWTCPNSRMENFTAETQG